MHSMLGKSSRRLRTLRVSGSENAAEPLKISLQELLLVPIPLDQRKS